MAKGGVPIGLSNVVYAFLVDDPAPGGVATYEAPKSIPGAISAKVNPNASNATLFADDGPYEVSSTVGEISLELNVADLPLEVQADVFGHELTGGVLRRRSTDIPPWVAIGFKSLKSSGGYRYTWLAKGKFALSEQNNETKGSDVNFNTPTANVNFVKRDCDDEWERHIDADHIDYVPSMGANWFNDPYGGAADTTAPTLVSVVPAAGATGVAVGANVVWTFSEALALSSVTDSNFVVSESDGTPIAGDLSINGARTVVTFNPTSNLAAATEHIAVATSGVKDVAGNALTPSVTKFTTA